MSNNANQISQKLTEIKKTISDSKFENKSEISAVLNELLECMSKVTVEISDMNKNIDTAKADIQDLEERFTEVEEYLEDEDLLEDDVIANINCPHCGAEVVVGKEFVEAEEPIIVCQSCNKQIEVLTSCGCGCDDDDCEDGCECGEGCDCGDDCDCDDECDCDCGSDENTDTNCCDGKCSCH